MSSQNNSGGGVGILGVLAIVFIVLKLVGVITWSWWLVTAPLWGGFLLVVILLSFFVIGQVLNINKRSK
jgi:hypothetical protein